VTPYYEQDGVTIYHGDCREVLREYVHADVIVTDPPYGISYESGFESSWGGTQISGDGDVSLRDGILQCFSVPSIVFGSWKCRRPAHTRQVLIWDKGPASGMGDLSFPWKNSFEEIYVIGDGFTGSRDEAVLRGHSMVTWESKGRQHPNQKPESLLIYLVRKCPNGVVLDPFMGSGTTVVAAKRLGRKAVGIEREERYCEIAAKRLAQGVLPMEAAS